jgi:mannonate dehydratase
MAVVAALEDHLKPWLIGKDPDRIEDLWQSAQMRTYWRNGPVNNNVLSAMDMALWDIKGKRAGMPVYEMLGGKARDGVPVYDHQGGKTKEECLDTLQKSLANGFTHVRIQLGGYGGGGFTRRARAIARKAATRAPRLMRSSMSMPSLLCSSTCATRPASGPSFCTTCTRT